MLDTLILIYFAVWVVMVAGTVFLFWGRSPAFKKRWHRPVSIVNGVVIGGFLLVLMVAERTPWPFFALCVGVGAFIIYMTVVKERICGKCGKTVQPQWSLAAPKFCPRCGASLSEDVTTMEG